MDSWEITLIQAYMVVLGEEQETREQQNGSTPGVSRAEMMAGLGKK